MEYYEPVDPKDAESQFKCIVCSTSSKPKIYSRKLFDLKAHVESGTHQANLKVYKRKVFGLGVYLCKALLLCTAMH